MRAFFVFLLVPSLIRAFEVQDIIRTESGLFTALQRVDDPVIGIVGKIDLTRELNISAGRSIKIVGLGDATLDAGRRGRHVNVFENGVFSAQNIRFKNGLSEMGGAIIVQSGGVIESLENCTFQSNSAQDNGGAIFTSESSVIESIVQCTFEGNVAENDGGAVCHEGKIAALSSVHSKEMKPKMMQVQYLLMKTAAHQQFLDAYLKKILLMIWEEPCCLLGVLLLLQTARLKATWLDFTDKMFILSHLRLSLFVTHSFSPPRIMVNCAHSGLFSDAMRLRSTEKYAQQREGCKNEGNMQSSYGVQCGIGCYKDRTALHQMVALARCRKIRRARGNDRGRSVRAVSEDIKSQSRAAIEESCVKCGARTYSTAGAPKCLIACDRGEEQIEKFECKSAPPDLLKPRHRITMRAV